MKYPGLTLGIHGQTGLAGCFSLFDGRRRASAAFEQASRWTWASRPPSMRPFQQQPAPMVLRRSTANRTTTIRHPLQAQTEL